MTDPKRLARNWPLSNLVPRVFSVLKESGDKVWRFPYSLKLTSICAKESF